MEKHHLIYWPMLNVRGLFLLLFMFVWTGNHSSQCSRLHSNSIFVRRGWDLHIHMRMHVPQKATTLEIWSALPHSGLIRQSLVCRQHLGQLLPELLLSVTLCFSGWVCLVSWCFSSHSSLWPFPIMLSLVWQRAGGMCCLGEGWIKSAEKMPGM